MRIQGKSNSSLSHSVILILSKPYSRVYRIKHVKKEQHIMEGSVNFLKGSISTFCLSIFLDSFTCFVRKKKSMQFPARPKTDTPPMRQP